MYLTKSSFVTEVEAEASATLPLVLTFRLIVVLIVVLRTMLLSLEGRVVDSVCSRILASNRACFFARVSNRLNSL